jgi:hypothetical protein
MGILIIAVKTGKRVIIVGWGLAVSDETAMADKINYLIAGGMTSVLLDASYHGRPRRAQKRSTPWYIRHIYLTSILR